MSFNNFARKVRDPLLPLSHRKSALGSCILRLGWLTGRKYQQVRACYASQYSLDQPAEPTEAQLVAAMAAIERDRNAYLEQLRAFDIKRIRQKMRGQRHPRKADMEHLEAFVEAMEKQAKAVSSSHED
jgi:hypothetical protein